MSQDNGQGSGESDILYTVGPPALSKYTVDPLQYINNIQEFHGEPEELKNFIEAVETVWPYVLQFDETGVKFFFVNIKRKVKGEAQKILNIYNSITNWNELKSILNNNFSEKKSSNKIYDELRNVDFQGTVLNFYNKIRSILSRLNLKIQSEVNNRADLIRISESNNRQALEIFKTKLGEPMFTVLQCRNPQNLEEALDILTEGNYLDRTSNNFFNANKRYKNFQANSRPPQRSNFSSGPRYNNTSNQQFNRPQTNIPRNNPNFRGNIRNYYNQTDNNNSPSQNSKQSFYSSRNSRMEVDRSTENFPLSASNNAYPT